MTRAAIAAIALTGACACGTSPPSTFYALAPESGAAQAGPHHAIRLRRPGIAGYLDRPEVVRTVADYKLGLVDTDRWAAPLDDMLGRVLAQDIEQRLPGTTVFTEEGSIAMDADATVEVEVRRLDEAADGEVTLVAEVALEKEGAHAPAATRAVSLHERPEARTTEALVHAMSDLVGQLADRIAGLVHEAG